jgi:excisionase family DNA binding protein
VFVHVISFSLLIDDPTHHKESGIIFPAMADTTISTKEAALLLNMSEPSVRSLLETGELVGFEDPPGKKRFAWRIDRRSVEAYLAANGAGRGVRRASKGRMARVEKEVASLRSLVEAGLPADAGLERLQQDRDDLRAQVVALTEATARGGHVAELQVRAETERAAVSEHLRGALGASERADQLRREAIAELQEAVAASFRAGHAGALRPERETG